MVALYEIEAINILFSKYKMACIITSVKEKCNSLRIYYEVVETDCMICRIIRAPFEWMSKICSNPNKINDILLSIHYVFRNERVDEIIKVAMERRIDSVINYAMNNV